MVIVELGYTKAPPPKLRNVMVDEDRSHLTELLIALPTKHAILVQGANQGWISKMVAAGQPDLWLKNAFVVRSTDEGIVIWKK